jgi:3'(2'), 5'-bisphosphate nucleotidase
LSPLPLSSLASSLVELAIEAGKTVMSVYSGAPEAWLKKDRSPFTLADTAAEAVILAGLQRCAPEIPVIAEEAVAAGSLPAVGDRFFLVDPLDGTREFLNRNGEFTINIALVDATLPVAGVVFAPALKRLFWAAGQIGAFETELATDASILRMAESALRAKPVPDRGLRALVSRSHRDAETEAWLKSNDIASCIAAGSSLKFCLIAAGEADIYPRFGRTMEWDTAAGQAILCAAGGAVLTSQGAPLRYGKSAQSFANPAFIAQGA